MLKPRGECMATVWLGIGHALHLISGAVARPVGANDPADPLPGGAVYPDLDCGGKPRYV
jgi:hypothetical protein